MTDVRTLTPAWEIKVDKVSKFKKYLWDGLIQRAMCTTGMFPDDLLVRQLWPSDLGLATWTTPPQEDGSTVWVDTIIGGRAFIGIYKLVLLGDDPTISSMEIGTPCITRGIYHLDELYSILPIIKAIRKQDSQWVLDTFGDIWNIRMEAYFSLPHFANQEERLVIKVASERAGKGNGLMLGGLVCEPRGQRLG